MAFRGTDNLPKTWDKCNYGGSNNRKVNGGCGRPVEKLAQKMVSKENNLVWFKTIYMDYCSIHKEQDPKYYEKRTNTNKPKIIN